MTYNTTHPELQDGEKFLSNENEESFRRIGWKTKRSGNEAYDVRGNVVKYLFPVFVQKDEYDEGMKAKEQKQ